MNQEYERGQQSWRGEKLVAAIMPVDKSYSRNGWRKLPRGLRCFRGWRLLCPTTSRILHTWLVWAALAIELVRLGYPAFAVGILILVDC